MKFDCGPTPRERRNALRAAQSEWHSWFAWYPVRVGPRECRWLEPVERRGDFTVYLPGLTRDFPYRWEYRAP